MGEVLLPQQQRQQTFRTTTARSMGYHLPIMIDDDARLVAGMASVQFRSFALAALHSVRLKGVRCHGQVACKNALHVLEEVEEILTLYFLQLNVVALPGLARDQFSRFECPNRFDGSIHSALHHIPRFILVLQIDDRRLLLSSP